MLKKSLTFMLIIVSPLFVAHGCSTTSTYSGASGIGVRHAGDLVFISKDKVILRYQGEEHTFRITEETKILAPIDKLKPGDEVSVLTTLEDEETALDVKGGLIEFQLNKGSLSPVR